MSNEPPMSNQGSPGETMQGGHLYMQTNEIQNAVIHYYRSASGTIAEAERVLTGGSGSGIFKPISGEASAPNAFEGAGSVILTPDRRFLFATNGGDNSVSTLVLRLNPADGENPKSFGLLGTHDIIATLYIVTGQMDPLTVVAMLRPALAACPDVLVGVSELPNNCGAAVRLLGPTSKAVQAAVRAAWNAARLGLPGTPAPNLRKG